MTSSTAEEAKREQQEEQGGDWVLLNAQLDRDGRGGGWGVEELPNYVT